MSRPAIEYRTASRSSVGARAHQEDSSRISRGAALVHADDGTGSNAAASEVLAVLADGMGGHVSGETASRLACDHFVEAFDMSAQDRHTMLAEALHQSNFAIRDAAKENPALKGMGCTIVAGYLDPDGLTWASVGDSALLMYRNGELSRLNADHSHGAMLDKQVEAGIISAEVAQNDRRRRALRSALTGNDIPIEEIEPDAYPLFPGDWVILASDGLLTLSGDEIATVINKHENESPSALADALLSEVAAKQAPHQDNTTIIAVKVMDPADAANIEMLDDVDDQQDEEGNSDTVTLIRPQVTYEPNGEPEHRGQRRGRMRILVVAVAMILFAIAAGLVIFDGEIILFPEETAATAGDP